MNLEKSISVGIVTYYTDRSLDLDLNLHILNKTLSYLNNHTYIGKVILIDNSPKSFSFAIDTGLEKVEYIYQNGLNHGFGKGHNIVSKYIDSYRYHLILNPDVSFDNKSDCISTLVDFLETNDTAVMVQPLIVDYRSNKIIRTCKKNPTFIIQFIRGFCPKGLLPIWKRYNDWYEMSDVAYRKKYIESQYLSGSFMLCKKKALDSIGWFDESYFLYLEDADLTRMLSSIGRCIHYPEEFIRHLWNRGSHRNLFHRWQAIKSFIIYTLKWGLKIL